jgi:hypothetical protein
MLVNQLNMIGQITSHKKVALLYVIFQMHYDYYY